MNHGPGVFYGNKIAEHLFMTDKTDRHLMASAAFIISTASSAALRIRWLWRVSNEPSDFDSSLR